MTDIPLECSIAERVAAARLFALQAIWLKRFTLDPDSLCPDDLKPSPGGHWGCVPGLTFILETLSAEGSGPVVLGTGHGAAAWYARSVLNGAFGPQTADSLSHLISSFGSSVPHEMSAFLPDVHWVGGALGHAVGIGQGLSTAKGSTVNVVIGDGELECGSTLGAIWAGARVSRHTRLFVNANEYRMGGRSACADRSDDQLLSWFQAQGWAASIVSQDDYIGLARALSMPLPAAIICRTEKGDSYCDIAPGGDRSLRRRHKLPIAKVETAAQLEWLRSWIAFYSDGYSALRALIGSSTSGGTSSAGLPSVVTAAIEPASDQVAATTTSEESSLAALMASLTRLHPRLVLTSPDEASSNLVADVVEEQHIFEVLNESLAAEWAIGFAIGDQPSALVTYEGFASLAENVYIQFDRFVAGLRSARKALPASSFLVLTSTAWQNVPSHQDPGAVAAFVYRTMPETSVFVPHRREAVASMGLDNSGLTVVVVEKRPCESPVGRIAASHTSTTCSWYLPRDGISALVVTVGEPVFWEAVTAQDAVEGLGILAIDMPEALIDDRVREMTSRISELKVDRVLVLSTLALPSIGLTLHPLAETRLLTPSLTARDQGERMRAAGVDAGSVIDWLKGS